MDLKYFLNERLEHTGFFFITATKSSEDIISSIEKEEPPYVPDYASDYDRLDEPQFLEEFNAASMGLQSVGIAAISMLAYSLQLFLEAWARKIEDLENRYKRTNKKRGWFFAYQEILKKEGLNLNDCPSNLKLIE